MRRHWSYHGRKLILAALLLLVIGLLIGAPGWMLAMGLLGYLFWTLHQAYQLQQWLANPHQLDHPPESIGLWGELFDGVYRLQQRHQQSQDRLQALVDRVQESTNSLQDAIIMTDAQGHMEWWNLAAERLLGFQRRSDQGQPIFGLIRSPAFKSYFTRKQYQEPLELSSPFRVHMRLQFQISLFGEGDRLVVARDVTRLHQLEQMRRDFVSNVSHELKTPLTVIRGYLETLETYQNELPPRWQRPLHSMAQQTHRMDALITDLILLSRIETSAHTQKEQAIPLAALLAQICDDARQLSGVKAHQISLDCKVTDGLQGDLAQLQSAFSNLIFNAVKYTPEKGRIQVIWRTDRQGGHLSVVDNGTGIDPIHIPRLTERFYRVDDSRKSDTGGTGLGLAIVKHALRNHEATLEIVSKLGQGSQFTCHFPSARLISLVENAQ